MDTGYDAIIARLQAAQDEATAANEARYTEATGIYDTIIAQYSEGGSYGEGVEAGLETQATKAVATGEQDLVSSGMYNTTQRAGLRSKFEEDVAAPTRLSLEQLRQDKLAAAQTAKAGLIERVTDEGPSNSLIAELAKRASSNNYSGATSYKMVGSNPFLKSATNPFGKDSMFK